MPPLKTLLLPVAIGFLASHISAQTPSTPAKSKDEIIAEISSKLDNPFSDLYLIWLENDTTTYTSDYLFDGTKAFNSVKLQPVLPVRLNDDWNLLQRPVLQYQTVPLRKEVGDLAGHSPLGILLDPELRSDLRDPFGDTTSGLGDLVYIAGLSPITKSKFVWGLGGTFIFPTATEDVLGQGKWQVGPAALAFYFGEKFNAGFIAQQWWSVAGDDDRPNTNQMTIQYFLNAPIGKTKWKVGMSPTISVNWMEESDERLTLPVGLGINRTFFLGKLPMRFGIEANYAVETPSRAIEQEWTFKLSLVSVIPHGDLARELKAAGVMGR